jgi:hypothetical protein
MKSVLLGTVTAYRDCYPLNRCSVFLCYYVFTASIMHVISSMSFWSSHGFVFG